MSGAVKRKADGEAERAPNKYFNKSNMNQKVLSVEYAVRGAIPDRAMELDNMIKSNPTGHGLPFEKTIQCNIGNPQALGQKPLSFNRQVLSLVCNPELHQAAAASPDGALGGVFKADAVRRAGRYLSMASAGVGAYTNSMGFEGVRQEIADFISKRDGHPSSVSDIFITDGASAGVRTIFMAMVRPGGQDGMLIPIPQYPLYSALTALFDGHMVGYYLNEEDRWTVSVESLQSAADAARSKGVSVRALTVINPGNPTGQCMDVNAMQDVVRFCLKNELVLLADEVYQENVYAQGKAFNSFKKVALDMGANNIEMVSFHSISKGFLGECGIRGGYMELYNIDPDVKAQIYKLKSITLCSNTHGQISVGLMVNPPNAGDESYETHVAERDGILSSLKRRASKLAAALNALDGVSCNPSEGAMYLFPQIQLPPAAVEAAKKADLVPDGFYCMQLLEETGIVTVPGSGFRQVDGTFHLRTTFLPSESDLDSVIDRYTKFQQSFMSKYAPQGGAARS